MRQACFNHLKNCVSASERATSTSRTATTGVCRCGLHCHLYHALWHVCEPCAPPPQQEITTDGMHVRTIGAGDCDGDVVSVASSSAMIAVGTDSEISQIMLFDILDGGLTRSFGRERPAVTQRCRSAGLRFTPDRHHIMVAESVNNRLTLFTLTGEFVRCFSSREPFDVDFAPSGDILATDCDNHSVCVYSPDGSNVLRSFGCWGYGKGCFNYPIALATHGDHLFVLDSDSPRVQVFR